MKWRVAGALIASLSILPALVHAQAAASAPPAPPAQPAGSEDEARAHFLLGRSLHERGDFAKAAAEFNLAYEASRRPALLYNLFLAYRDANDDVHAADALRRYLAEEPNVDNRPQLEARLQAMDAAIAAAPAQPVPSDAQPAPLGPEPTAQPASDQPAMTDSEPVAEGGSSFPVGPVIVMGVGGAMMLGSIATGILASGAQSDLEKACPTRMDCDADLADTQSKGETFALLTDVLLFGGIAVAGAGVAWWLLAPGDAESSPPRGVASAGLMCVPGGCAGAVHGTF